MRYGFIYLVILYVLGVWCGNLFSSSLLVITAMLSFIALLYFVCHKRWFGIVLFVIVFWMGYINVYLTHNPIATPFNVINEKTGYVTGEITEVGIKESNKFSTYIVYAESFEYASEIIPINKPMKINIYSSDTSAYTYGDKIRVYGKIAKLHYGNSNQAPYIKASYDADNIHYAVNVQSGRHEKITGESVLPPVLRMSAYIRRNSASALEHCLKNDTLALAFAKSVLINDSLNLDNETYNVLKTTGMYSLTRIKSTSVVWVIAILFMFFLVSGGKRNIWIYVSCIPMLFILFAIGFDRTVMRAAITLYLYLIIEKAAKVTSKINAFALTVLIMGIADVGYLLSISFVYSSAAIVCIHCFAERFKEISNIKNSTVKNMYCTWKAAQIGITPIAAYGMSGVTPVVGFANFLFMPLTAMFIIIGYLGIVFAAIFMPLGMLLLKVFAGYANVVVYVSGILYGLNIQKTVLPGFDIIALIVYSLLMYVYYMYLNDAVADIKVKLSGAVIASLVFVIIVNTAVAYNRLEVAFLDVGQADATIITLPKQKYVLMDSGGAESYSDYDYGNSFYVPYLLSNGIYNIDTAFVSHYHKDHCEGMIAVLERLKVDTLVMPYTDTSNEYKTKLEKLARASGTKIQYVGAGDTYTVDNAVFNILSPPKPNLIIDENDLSLIVKFTCNNTSYLFTGDSGIGPQDYAISKGDVTCDVLKVAHHGAKTSLNEKLLIAASPNYAVISVGENNSFGHPSPEVTDKLNKLKIQIFRTDKNGNITFISNKNGICKIRFSKSKPETVH